MHTDYPHLKSAIIMNMRTPLKLGELWGDGKDLYVTVSDEGHIHRLISVSDLGELADDLDTFSFNVVELLSNKCKELAANGYLLGTVDCLAGENGLGTESDFDRFMKACPVPKKKEAPVENTGPLVKVFINYDNMFVRLYKPSTPRHNIYLCKTDLVTKFENEFSFLPGGGKDAIEDKLESLAKMELLELLMATKSFGKPLLTSIEDINRLLTTNNVVMIKTFSRAAEEPKEIPSTAPVYKKGEIFESTITFKGEPDLYLSMEDDKGHCSSSIFLCSKSKLKGLFTSCPTTEDGIEWLQKHFYALLEQGQLEHVVKEVILQGLVSISQLKKIDTLASAKVKEKEVAETIKQRIDDFFTSSEECKQCGKCFEQASPKLVPTKEMAEDLNAAKESLLTYLRTKERAPEDTQGRGTFGGNFFIIEC